MIEPGSYKCNYSDIYRITYGVSEKRDLKIIITGVAVVAVGITAAAVRTVFALSVSVRNTSSIKDRDPDDLADKAYYNRDDPAQDLAALELDDSDQDSDRQGQEPYGDADNYQE